MEGPSASEKKEETKTSNEKPRKKVPDPPAIPVRLIRVEGFTTGEKMVKGTRSNHYMFVNNCNNCTAVIPSNQRAHKIVIANSSNCIFQVHDSVVISTQTVELVNLSKCNILFDEVDVRILNCFNVNDCTLQFTNEATLIDNMVVTWFKGSKTNDLQRVMIKPGTDPNKVTALPVVPIKEAMWSIKLEDIPVDQKPTDDQGVVYITSLPDGEKLQTICKVVDKPRTSELVTQEVNEAWENNKLVDALSREQLGKMYDDEIEEFEDAEDVLMEKVKEVADAIKKSKHCVMYTGAGVSTSAKIPDYRGPQGVWTLKNKGTMSEGMKLSQALPTYTHYAMTELWKKGLVKYVISTNLDGLHRRSGISAEGISELHGNCYREVCGTCGKEYLRGFDTLTTRDDRWTHLTGRKCDCGGPLKDTIIHFTENMPAREMNLAMQHARDADVAIVLGTSMNVQPAASLPDKALKNPNGKFIVINLQRTPYDNVTSVKVYARTDNFMKLLMKALDMEKFDLEYDHLEVLRKEEQKKEDEKKEEDRKKSRKQLFTVALPVTIAVVGVAVLSLFKSFK